jgi:hypothetical protein
MENSKQYLEKVFELLLAIGRQEKDSTVVKSRLISMLFDLFNDEIRQSEENNTARSNLL